MATDVVGIPTGGPNRAHGKRPNRRLLRVRRPRRRARLRVARHARVGRRVRVASTRPRAHTASGSSRPTAPASGVGPGRRRKRWTVARLPAELAARPTRSASTRSRLLGYSGGGPFALAAAHAFPDRVIAAAIVSGAGQVGVWARVADFEPTDARMTLLSPPRSDRRERGAHALGVECTARAARVEALRALAAPASRPRRDEAVRRRRAPRSPCSRTRSRAAPRAWSTTTPRSARAVGVRRRRR